MCAGKKSELLQREINDEGSNERGLWVLKKLMQQGELPNQWVKIKHCG
jgi:hypothetical protein